MKPERGNRSRLKREMCRAQLSEVPDNVRVFDDFRELPDDIFDAHGDVCPCPCECCARTCGEEVLT